MHRGDVTLTVGLAPPKPADPPSALMSTTSVLCLVRLPHLKKLRCELKGTLRSFTILRVPSQAAASLQAAHSTHMGRGRAGKCGVWVLMGVSGGRWESKQALLQLMAARGLAGA
jgi:hypothetical protein